MNWRTIKGYEGMYEVSDTGLIRGLDRTTTLKNGQKRIIKGKMLKQRLNNCGYVEVRLCKNGLIKMHFVHRLVATTFLDNQKELPQVNHKSGDKQDNSVANLEWTDARGNALHAYQTGLNTNCGCNHSLAVAVIDIKTGNIYCTVKAFCDSFGINYNSGRNALNGIQAFPKSIDLSKHSFEKYTC